MITILALLFFLNFQLKVISFATGPVTYYINTTKGSNSNNGTNAATPWRTIQRINRQVLLPGDSVLFARGEIFRGHLKANSGIENHRVVYASYGSGSKPKLLGSIQRNKTSDWISISKNIWQTTNINFDDNGIDVGNIIFDSENIFGIKVSRLNKVNKQGVSWSDTANRRVVLYSTANPAKYYSDVELALTRDIIKENYASYVTYIDLDLRYGGAHGIGGDSTHHITIQDVDISCMGGGYLFGFDLTRYRNGVEFYNAANNNVVERCRFSQIYDVAMTSQGDKPWHQVYNLTFRNNIIDKCEQSFELWLRGGGSSIRDVYFENNTSTNAGYGMLHPQRPDTNGTFLLFWGFSDDVTVSDVYIRNNIFSNPKNWGIYWYNSNDISKMRIDNNCWYLQFSPIAKVREDTHDIYFQPDDYRTKACQDQHSIFKDPKFKQALFSLSVESPCINAGITLERIKDDYTGSLREDGLLDIGAFEYK